jgi:hypothetical protein
LSTPSIIANLDNRFITQFIHASYHPPHTTIPDGPFFHPSQPQLDLSIFSRADATLSLGIPLTPCHVSKFLSLETSVQIHSSVRDEDVFIIQSPSPPAINDHLMELLIMISGE